MSLLAPCAGNYESPGTKCAFNTAFEPLAVPSLTKGFNWTDENRGKWGVRRGRGWRWGR